MKVRLKKDCNVYKLNAGYEFTVDHHDNGFYSNIPFYSGWVVNENGLRVYATFHPNYCEVVDYEN